jgi:hypothetical protein
VNEDYEGRKLVVPQYLSLQVLAKSYVNGSEGRGGDEGWGKAIKSFWEFHFHVHGAGSDQRPRSTYDSFHKIILGMESNKVVQGATIWSEDEEEVSK